MKNEDFKIEKEVVDGVEVVTIVHETSSKKGKKTPKKASKPNQEEA